MTIERFLQDTFERLVVLRFLEQRQFRHSRIEDVKADTSRTDTGTSGHLTSLLYTNRQNKELRPLVPLLMIPEPSAGCVCQFSIEATVVMVPRQEADTWKIASLAGSATPVQQLSINLGAPGDRRDTFGTLWLAYPRPATVDRLEFTFDIKPKLASGGGYYNYNSEAVQIENANTPWVLTSGVRGLSQCELTLLGDNDKPATYAIKLHFAQIEECGVGEAVFDIRLQGDTVAEKMDVVREAGATSRALVRTFDNIPVDKNLTIELVSHGEMLPTLSAIEVTRR